MPLAISDTDDEIEILTIKVSNDEKYICILAGKNCIKAIEEIW